MCDLLSIIYCCLNCKSDKLRLFFVQECVENNSNRSVVCREYVRPESYKIVMIIFYLSLWKKYIFRQKYWRRKNISHPTILLLTKY